MYLNDAQRQAIILHINRKWRDHRCDRCKRNSWQIYGYVSVTLTPVPSTVQSGGPGLPTAALVCGNCGNTVYLNLKIAGVPGIG